MFILGSIIRLAPESAEIPLPWWHRAPLGMETDTQVYVSVTKPTGARPGDVLVSVLDPSNWEQQIIITCLRDDEPGVIEEVFSNVPLWNIALAETVTVESGKLHQVDLICEPSTDSQRIEDIEATARQLQADFQKRFPGARVSAFPSTISKVERTKFGIVKNGWVTFSSRKGEASWRDIIQEQIKELNLESEFDLDRLVISGETGARVLRGVIPRRGTLTVSIEHKDRPGVLVKLTKALRDADVNVLSSLLKRGKADFGNAILVAVCEPLPNAKDVVGIEQRIRKNLQELPPQLRVEILSFSYGFDPEKVVYSRHPDDIVARVPKDLKARVLEIRNSYKSNRPRIFLSRRFNVGDRADEYANKVKNILNDLGCIVVEAPVRPGDPRAIPVEVAAAMWAAQAGIVLGATPEKKNQLAVGVNIAHEYGFMQGQGKPVILLVQKQSRIISELEAWSNIKGFTTGMFSGEHATSDAHIESLKHVIEEWYGSVAQLWH